LHVLGSPGSPHTETERRGVNGLFGNYWGDAQEETPNLPPQQMHVLPQAGVLTGGGKPCACVSPVLPVRNKQEK